MYSTYKKVYIPETKETVATGWLPPVPDFRDYTLEHPEMINMLKKMGTSPKKMERPFTPPKIDLREWCSPIENQGILGSCTAQAAVGIVEYLENKAFGKHIDGSRLFVYKATRNLKCVSGDTGAWLRETMGSLVLCGVPPERYWPYTDRTPDFDAEPSSFVYAVADDYEALRYFCVDPLGGNRSRQQVLGLVQLLLAMKIPCMFGFWGFPSSGMADVVGGIPYPCVGEVSEWGHAVVAVGYDKEKKINNTKCDKVTEGALLIRNSWGTGWGDNGYGWLPFQYVLDGLALDFWYLLGMDWVDTGRFGLTSD